MGPERLDRARTVESIVAVPARVGRHGQARCWFDTRHKPPGWRQALPCADRIQLVERGADPATGKQLRLGFGHRGRDPGLAASGRGSVYAPGDSTEPRPGHPLHPMIGGHATGQKQRRAYSDRHCLRIGYSRSPGGVAKAVLSPSSPPPERPRPHSLAGAPGSGGGSAPVV